MTNVKKREHKSKPATKNVASSKQIIYEFRKALHNYFPNLREEYKQEYINTPLQIDPIAVYYLRGDKTEKSTKLYVEQKQTKFIYMTSIPETKTNSKELFIAE